MGGTGGQLESRVHISAIVLDPGPQLLHALRFGHSIGCVSCCPYSCSTDDGWVRGIICLSNPSSQQRWRLTCTPPLCVMQGHGSMSMRHKVCTQPTCVEAQPLPVADLLVSLRCACHIPGPLAQERTQGQGAVLLCRRGLLQEGNLAHWLQDPGGVQKSILFELQNRVVQPVSEVQCLCLPWPVWPEGDMM